MADERKVMHSYGLACEAIKTTVVNNVVETIRKGRISIPEHELKTLVQIIEMSVDQAKINASKQIRSSLT